MTMQSDFYTKAHAKWILAGEHAVLRGHPALVFPIPSRFIELFYWEGHEPLEINFNATHEESILILFWNAFEEGLKLLQKSTEAIKGRIFFHNNIPMGAGMGFSAAFCVSIARWFLWKGWLDEHQLFEFSRQLENYFHGKSSGVDIAGALYDTGMFFRMTGERRAVQLHWRPHLCLSHSGHISVTSKCIHVVNTVWEKDKTTALAIDRQMAESVLRAEKALTSDASTGLIELTKAMQLANDCFHQWGLMNMAMQTHADQLKQAGALACKPTGAGDGGYMLSLWNKMPELSFEMIAVL